MFRVSKPFDHHTILTAPRPRFFYRRYDYTPNAFGATQFDVQGSKGAEASVANLTLPLATANGSSASGSGGSSGAGLWVVHACCDYWSVGPSPHATSTATALVMRNDLQVWARAFVPCQIVRVYCEIVCCLSVRLLCLKTVELCDMASI